MIFFMKCLEYPKMQNKHHIFDVGVPTSGEGGVGGSNRYKIPSLEKDKILRLPLAFEHLSKEAFEPVAICGKVNYARLLWQYW